MGLRTRKGDSMVDEALRLKTRHMTELIALIQRYPKEARRVVAAVEDGLVLGRAQVMSWGLECDADASTEG